MRAYFIKLLKYFFLANRPKSSIALSGLLIVSSVAALELYWRSNGFKPTITDSKAYWSYHRSRVYQSEKTVVLLGASRMQAGFVVDTFLKRYPGYHVVNLAIDGKHPAAVLKDLSEDEDFNGIVLCAVTAPFAYGSYLTAQQQYVDYFHKQFGVADIVSGYFQGYLQSTFASFNNRLKFHKVIGNLVVRDRLPSKPHRTLLRNRSTAIDYSRLNRAKFQERYRKHLAGARMANKKSWLRGVAQVERSVKKLQERGSQVVFVRFPTTDALWQLQQIRTPKHEFWDTLVSKTSAKTFHFHENPELMKLDCPDSSHLDFRDAPKFTQLLLNELDKRMVF